MPQPPLSLDAAHEVWEAVREHGTILKAARANGWNEKTVDSRYKVACRRFGFPDVATRPGALLAGARPYDPDNEAECALSCTLGIADGVAVAFSDAHWRELSQPRTLAHEALLRLLPLLKPSHLFALGDLLDLSSVSRHDPLGWERRIDVASELAAGQTHLADIVTAAPDAARLWVRGNHDDRFDKFLAKNAAPLTGVPGTRLVDHFPGWALTHRATINGDVLMVHRWHGGVHAAYNNALKSGLTTISGDTHALEVRPFMDIGGRRWGVQTGMLADPRWPQFAYRLGLPGQQSMGFVVLTWQAGRLLPPEIVECIEGAAWFRGELICGRVRRQAGRG